MRNLPRRLWRALPLLLLTWGCGNVLTEEPAIVVTNTLPIPPLKICAIGCAAGIHRQAKGCGTIRPDALGIIKIDHSNLIISIPLFVNELLHFRNRQPTQVHVFQKNTR